MELFTRIMGVAFDSGYTADPLNFLLLVYHKRRDLQYSKNCFNPASNY